METNKGIFDVLNGGEVEDLWEKVRFLSALWASVQLNLKTTFSSIFLDWKAAVEFLCFWPRVYLFLRLLLL